MRRTLKGVIRPLAFQVTNGVWALLFLLLGKLLRPRPHRLQVTGKERVLVIAPHSDDETLGCGGALALHAYGNDKVCVLVITDGGGSKAGGLSREEMVRQREAELKDALRVLAPTVQVVRFSLPEGEWFTDDLRGPLGEMLKQFNPTLIYAPSCVDYHPEHIRVAQALAERIAHMEQSSCHAIRVYEVQVPLTPVLANLAADISRDIMSTKRLALSQYRTQAASLGAQSGAALGWPYRHAMYLRLLYRAKEHIEVFWDMTPEQYCEVMQRSSERRLRFRGLRPRPFTDGLAWVVGLRERYRLKEILRIRALE